MWDLLTLRYNQGPQAPTGIELVPGFTDNEFVCKCCGKYWADPVMLGGLATIRRILNKPVIITSAYRCPKHNKEVGGATNSLHLRGKAVDIYIKGVTAADMAKMAETVEVFRNGGIGTYTPEEFIHVDTGPKRRWKRVNGVYC